MPGGCCNELAVEERMDDSHGSSSRSFYVEESDYNDEDLRRLTQELTQSEGDKFDVDLSQKCIDQVNDAELSQKLDVNQTLSQSIQDCLSDDEDCEIVESFLNHNHDYYNYETPPPQKRRKSPDTEDIVRTNEYGRYIERKKGDAFTLKTSNKQKIYVVERFILGQIKRSALCRVFERLENTFVNEEEQGSLTKYSYTMYRYPETIEVRKLGKKLRTNPPATSLLYETKSIGCGKTFEVTYSFIRCDYDIFEKEPYDLKPRTVLDLFCGAGGMSEGFKRHGFLVKWGVDNDPLAAGTYQINHPNAVVFEEDLQDFMTKVREGRVPSYNFQPDHIHASPPCQAFSLANRFGGKNDELNKRMTLEFIKAVEHFKTATVSMENVTGLLRSKHRKYLQKVVAKLIALDYQVRVFILDSSSYGDSQARERVFLFGARRKGVECPSDLPSRPSETHGPSINQESVKTVKDVLYDLEEVEPGTGITVMRDGKTEIHNHTSSSIKLKSESEKLSADQPARTVRGGNNFLHYRHSRCLTLRELARLQGFPDNHRFVGSQTAIRKQIGNAVPVNLASAVALEIKKALFRDLDEEEVKELWVKK